MPEFPSAEMATAISGAEAPEDFHAALRLGVEFLDRLNDRAIAETGVQLACRAGCSLCCSLRVDAFAHEIFLLADFVRASFSPEQLGELRDRLESHCAQVLPLTPYEHATRNIVCPLLREGRCSAYAARPQACRRHHSQDFAACQYCYDHPTDLEFPGAHDANLFQSLSAVMQQSIDTYALFGFDDTIYELGTALAEALRAPDRWERWVRRERAFLTASITESSSSAG